MDKRQKIAHTVIRTAMLSAALGGNTKGLGKILAKAEDTSTGAHLALQVEAASESDTEFLDRLMQTQDKIVSLVSEYSATWSMEAEARFSEAIAAYNTDLSAYNTRLAVFNADKQNYEALKTLADRDALEAIIEMLEQEYKALNMAYDILLSDYKALLWTQEQRDDFFGSDGDITAWILAEMGYNYEGNQLYKVNYSYNPSEWRRVFSVPGGLDWSTKGFADIFDMSISPQGVEGVLPITSFCAYLGSHHFSGEGEMNTGIGYLLDVNPFDNNFAAQGGRDMTPEQYKRIVSAYNYLVDAYGQLDGEYRVITQVITWMLLDEQFNFNSILEGKGETLEVLEQNGHDPVYGGLTAREKIVIEDVLVAVNNGYQGLGQIYAFLYLVGINEDGTTLSDPIQAQPQIVPIYTVDVPNVTEFLAPDLATMDISLLEDEVDPPVKEKEEEKIKPETPPVEQDKKDEPKVAPKAPKVKIEEEVSPKLPTDLIASEEEKKVEALPIDSEVLEEETTDLPETGEKDPLTVTGVLGLTAMMLALYRMKKKDKHTL